MDEVAFVKLPLAKVHLPFSLGSSVAVPIVALTIGVLEICLRIFVVVLNAIVLNSLSSSMNR